MIQCHSISRLSTATSVKSDGVKLFQRSNENVINNFHLFNFLCKLHTYLWRILGFFLTSLNCSIRSTNCVHTTSNFQNTIIDHIFFYRFPTNRGGVSQILKYVDILYFTAWNVYLVASVIIYRTIKSVAHIISY